MSLPVIGAPLFYLPPSVIDAGLDLDRFVCATTFAEPRARGPS
jgi:hypothetical protein